jgi:formamidopyrimidine-DNA glycosylase
MPELPEVQTIASELDKKIVGKTIRKVIVNAPKMVAVGPEVVSNIRTVKNSQIEQFKKLLVNKKVISVTRRAKILIFKFSGHLSMLVHLKMTGQFIYEDKKLRSKTGGKYRMLNKLNAPLVLLPGKHTHVIFYFTDGSTLYFNDVRKFGYLKLVRDDELLNVKELLEFGPEPLSKQFTLSLFCASLKGRKGKKISVKQLLMDYSFVAGIGNIYSDEILFHAGVRPTRGIKYLSDKDIQRIYNWIKPVLIQGIKSKGSSVGDFVRTDGSWGQMGKYHFVYGRKGQKCKKCGTIITAVKLGGRTGSYCPNCQK